MSKVLKRLYLGDIVKSFGTKQLRKLTTEKPQEESVIGTWLIKDDFSATAKYGAFKIDFVFSHQSKAGPFYEFSCTALGIGYQGYVAGIGGAGQAGVLAFQIGEMTTASCFSGKSQDIKIIINGGEDANNPSLLSWLKANATRVEGESIIDTWVWKDTLDLSENVTTQTEFCLRFTSRVETSSVKTKFDRIQISDGRLRYRPYIENPGEGSIILYSTVYNVRGDKTWEYETAKTITFPKGTIVTDENGNDITVEFYKLLSANATKIEQESVIGTWRFNDTLSSENFVSVGVTKQYTGDPLNEDDILFYFTQDDGVVLYCTGMKKMSSGSICCTQYSSGGAHFLFPYNFSDNTFQKDYYKTITFVKDVKSTSFINWLKANATKQ